MINTTSNSHAAITATLTHAVKNSIQIENFIFHIIRKDDDIPDYNDEVTINNEQKLFFEERIRKACDGTQFIFTDPDNNTCKHDCNKLLEDTQNKFVPISKELTKRFFDSHKGSMSDGVFIIAIISVLLSNTRINLLSFLKVDFSTVYQQKLTEKDGKKVIHLSRIMDSLADNADAMQKWAIIDPSDIFAWDVVASQRYSSKEKQDTDQAISKYFKNFLQVSVRENPSVLTIRTVTETSKWVSSLNDLPANLFRGDFKARAINYFENTDRFDTDKFIDQVLGSYASENDQDDVRRKREELRQQHTKLLKEKLEEVGIAGQTFQSRPNSIPKKTKTNKWTTNTGVTILFQGTSKNHNIDVSNKDGQYYITIRTTQLDQG